MLWQQAAPVPWHLPFHGKAVNFGRDRMADAAMGLGAALDSLPDGDVEFVTAVENGSSQLPLFYVPDVGGLASSHEREQTFDVG
jgi:hypothetical protein